MEVGRMPYKWPADTDFALRALDVIDRACPDCGRMMYICDHRYRRLHTLDGPVQLVCKLNHCPDPACPGHARTKSPELEMTIAPPSWAIGWDVFCWIGHRRCSRHMSIPLIQSELLDDYAIKLSDDAIAKYIRRYQAMLARGSSTTSISSAGSACPRATRGGFTGAVMRGSASCKTGRH